MTTYIRRTLATLSIALIVALWLYALRQRIVLGILVSLASCAAIFVGTLLADRKWPDLRWTPPPYWLRRALSQSKTSPHQSPPDAVSMSALHRSVPTSAAGPIRVRWVVVGLLTLTGACIAGLWIAPKAFLVNLLATTVGIVLSVAIAVSLVDGLLRQRRHREWQRVAGATTVAIRTHVVEFLVQCWTHLGGRNIEPLGPPLEGRNQASGNVVRGADLLLETMRALPLETGTDQLHDDVKWDLGQIRDVLTPRVLTMADDQPLVERLVALEDAERAWISLLIADYQAGTGGTLRGAIGTIEAARDLCALVAGRERE